VPWYKIDIRYGPGHQSHRVAYRHAYERLTNEEQSDLAHEYCDQQLSWVEQWKADVDEVSELPEEARKKLVEQFENKRDHAERMLKILRG
jgi:hypothetical protein